jgi:hypothetical protein
VELEHQLCFLAGQRQPRGGGGRIHKRGYPFLSSQVYLQQNKKKAEAESKNCHAKTMLSLEKPIKLM